MDLSSMAIERAPYFKTKALHVFRKTIFDLMYPDTHHLQIPLVEVNVIEDALVKVSQELRHIFDEMVEPYDNELRRICLQLAVESIDNNKDYHNPASIIQRAKLFEQYVYGILPEQKEDPSTQTVK